MKRIFSILVVLIMLSSCAGSKAVIPKMDIPTAPIKPQIQSQVVTDKTGNIWIGYKIPDALKLYEYLIRMNVDREKLVDRIEMMSR